MILGIAGSTKSKLISKCLLGVFNSSKKQTKEPNSTMIPQVNFFRSFFRRIEDTKKTFRN